jgi:anti-anti-sigma regulatory factor
MAKINASVVALPAIVDLDALDMVRDQLVDAMDTGPTSVSGDKVERIATNALLMLVSAAETARRNGHSFEVRQPSVPMMAAIERLGLAPSFAGMIRG